VRGAEPKLVARVSAPDSTENTQGLRLQDLPRALDFRSLTQDDLDATGRPDQRTPLQTAFQDTLTSTGRDVELTPRARTAVRDSLPTSVVSGLAESILVRCPRR
jgi:hypothetical protein